MAPQDPTQAAKPTGVAPDLDLDTDTGRRNRRTRQYSDGFVPLDALQPSAQGSIAPAEPPRVRVRPLSDTLTELKLDRAAVALPQVPDELVVQDGAPTRVLQAAADDFGPADEVHTYPDARTATAVMALTDRAADQPTARELQAVQVTPAWQRPLTLACAAAMGSAAAWLVFGRTAPPAPPQTPPPPVRAQANAANALPPLAPPPQAPVEPAASQGAAPAEAPAPQPAASSPTTIATPESAAKAQAPAAAAPPRDPCAGYDRTVVGTGADPVAPYLALRRAPDESAGQIAQLPDGTRLRILGSHGRWRRVAVCHGQTGWVHGRWLAQSAGGQP